jgi:signal transduction histidine kinase
MEGPVSDNCSDAANAVTEEARLGQELDHLYRFTGTIGSNRSVENLLSDALDPIRAMAQADKVSLVLVASDDGTVMENRQQGWENLTDPGIQTSDIAKLGTEAINVDDVGVLRGMGIELPIEVGESAAVVPLTAYGRPLGLLVVVRKSGFSATTLKLLNTAGRQFALAIKNARLFADLETSYHRLIDSQEELIRSERLAALGGLAATMAHEIRNPLATLFSSLSQIRKHAQITGDSATLLEIAEEESVRLNKMVTGLLEFARPRMPRSDEVHPAEVISELVTVLANGDDFPGGVEIRFDPSATDLVVSVDSELFKRTLQHVLNNAVAAVEPERGRIEISILAGDDQVGGMEVVVKDNGCGIAPDIMNNIFEPFFSTKPSGVGLGLSVARRIVEDHKGSVEIDSEVGIGTTIQLLFGGESNPVVLASLVDGEI